LELGATDSAHEVFFAHDAKRTVAVKPYKQSKKHEEISPVARAEHEFEMLKRIRDLGFTTLSPVKIDQTRDGTIAYLLTDYVPNLRTMSSIVQQRSQVVPSLLKRTAETLGALHSYGYSHGDAQVKNFGITPADKGRIAVFDPEKGGSDTIGHVKSDPFQHDLDSLVQSLAHKSYGGPNTEQAAETVLRDVIWPYEAVAAQGLGLEKAQEIGSRALNTHMDKHSELRAPKSPIYR